MKELSLEEKRKLKPKDVVLNKIKKSSYFTEFEEDFILWVNDREVVIEAVKKFGAALKYTNDGLKNDKEIVLYSVKQNGYGLGFVSDLFKDDAEVVLAAIKQNGLVLEYASDRFKRDKKTVKIAMKHNVFALAAASEELQDDRQLLLYLREWAGKQRVSCNKDSSWFIKKMEVLDSLEEDTWMRNNIPLAKNSSKPRKF